MTENHEKTAEIDRKQRKMMVNEPKTGENSSSRLSRPRIDLEFFLGAKKIF